MECTAGFRGMWHLSSTLKAILLLVFVADTDIEDKKMLELSLQSMQAKLAEADRISTVAEIAASVVHEISQPLSAIAFNAQTCLRELGAEPLDRAQLQEAVDRLHQNSREATQIVRNIRALFPPQRT